MSNSTAFDHKVQLRPLSTFCLGFMPTNSLHLVYWHFHLLQSECQTTKIRHWPKLCSIILFLSHCKLTACITKSICKTHINAFKIHLIQFTCANMVKHILTVSGLQLRKSEQNGFHDNFLISQPNPMMWPSLKSSLRDDSNECNIIVFGWEIRKIAFWKYQF